MKLTYEFDPFEEFKDLVVPKERRSEVMEEVAAYLKEQTLSYVGEGRSPVAGEGTFPKLSEDYKKKKSGLSSSPIANLELSGDMLDALDFTAKRDKVVVSITGVQGDKADGHCNFSGNSELPQRRFIPNSQEDQTYRREIMAGVREILERAAE